MPWTPIRPQQLLFVEALPVGASENAGTNGKIFFSTGSGFCPSRLGKRVEPQLILRANTPKRRAEIQVLLLQIAQMLSNVYRWLWKLFSHTHQPTNQDSPCHLQAHLVWIVFTQESIKLDNTSVFFPRKTKGWTLASVLKSQFVPFPSSILIVWNWYTNYRCIYKYYIYIIIVTI